MKTVVEIFFAIALLIYESIVEIAPYDSPSVAELSNGAVNDLVSSAVRIFPRFAARKNRR
jgi:hypothetical protein